MKTFIPTVAALSLAAFAMACGSSSKGGGDSSTAVPDKKVVTITTLYADSSTQSATIQDSTYLSQLQIKVEGVQYSDVAVALLGAPSQVSLASTSSNGTEQDYGLSAASLDASTYNMTVVVRDIARCDAKETDKSICDSSAGITQVIDDYDTTQALALTVNTTTTPSVLTSTATSTSLDTSTIAGEGGGLFANFCSDVATAGKLKTWFCSLINN